MALEEAIYKKYPAIEVYRQKIVQFLKKEVLKRATSFPYNLHGFIEQQPEVTATSITCLLCDATIGEKINITITCSPLKVALHKGQVSEVAVNSSCCSINPCRL